MTRLERTRGRGERIINDLEMAVEELVEFHEQAEGEFNYHCPGCHACMVVIPELKRMIDSLEFNPIGG